MPVDFDTFVDWAESRFGDIIVSYPEVKINSIFKDNDQDHKLWCNPDGGKDNIELGVYHCWKTGETGTLAGLVMEVDGCAFEDAVDILGGDTPLTELQGKIEDFFDNLQTKEAAETEESVDLKLPHDTYAIDELPPWNPYRQRAEIYLRNRKIPTTNLMVCTEGIYRNRIVIPYYDEKGKLIYFNCRALNDKQIPKYRGPEKDLGIGKGDVIFMPKWPPKGEKLYITEGEFDALSLFYSELYSAAMGGKNLSAKQIQLLKDYIPVITVDNDEAGRLALLTIGDYLLEQGFEVYYVRPPQGFKDWNALFEEYDAQIIKGYISTNEKLYTENTSVELLEKSL